VKEDDNIDDEKEEDDGIEWVMGVTFCIYGRRDF